MSSFHLVCYLSFFSLPMPFQDHFSLLGYGGAKNLKGIESNSISHIFNFSPKNCPDLFKEKPGLAYTDIDIGDNPEQDLLAYIGPFVKQIEELKAQKKNILIHCYKVKTHSPPLRSIVPD